MNRRVARPRGWALAVLLFFLAQLGLAQPAPAYAAKQDGTVRVLLTQLNLLNRLDIGIYGAYSLEDRFTFQRGAVLRMMAEKERILLFYEGLTLDAGPQIILRRHAAPEGLENGLRLQGGLNLCEGDLQVSVQKGQLRAILTIGVEDYLKGVVPYEMSDSFPLEALKAQAVAARTYALKRLKPNEAFDLYDNTNDQVYKGYDSANRNAVAAIEATRGLCASYGNALAECYYTASNGGWTESIANAWGRADQPYLKINEDRYDIENPESPVREARLKKQLAAGMAYNDALTQTLRQGVLQATGHTAPDPLAMQAVQLQTIQAVEVRAPKHKNGRVYTALRITLTANYVQPMQSPASNPDQAAAAATAGAATTAVTLEIPIFPYMENALGLSINANDNEVWSVEETAEEFVIRARRYGHGVGMSQRGAQWMAKTYDWGYEKIVQFYYPGVALVKKAETAMAPPPLNETFLITPGPIPTPTPKPTLMPLLQTPAPGQSVVYVREINRNSSLNLREKPDLTSAIITQLYWGQPLLVTEKLPSGWLRVKTDAIEGYVMEKFVNAQ